jgi:hypothetical protein
VSGATGRRKSDASQPPRRNSAKAEPAPRTWAGGSSLRSGISAQTAPSVRVTGSDDDCQTWAINGAPVFSPSARISYCRATASNSSRIASIGSASAMRRSRSASLSYCAIRCGIGEDRVRIATPSEMSQSPSLQVAIMQQASLQRGRRWPHRRRRPPRHASVPYRHSSQLPAARFAIRAPCWRCRPAAQVRGQHG